MAAVLCLEMTQHSVVHRCCGYANVAVYHGIGSCCGSSVLTLDTGDLIDYFFDLEQSVSGSTRHLGSRKVHPLVGNGLAFLSPDDIEDPAFSITLIIPDSLPLLMALDSSFFRTPFGVQGHVEEPSVDPLRNQVEGPPPLKSLAT